MDTEARRYWAKVIAFSCLVLVAIIAGAILVMPLYEPIGYIVWLFVIVGGSGFLLIKWHAKNTTYICPKCGHAFTISVQKDAWSPHIPTRKLLRCPECRKRSWCKAVSINSIKSKISDR